jgi:hypothetical protein
MGRLAPGVRRVVLEKDPQTRPMNRRLLLPALFALAAFLPSPALACAVCMGDPNSYIAGASNSVIWMLLGLVGFIFVSTGGTAYYLWSQSRKEIPPHIQLVEKLTDEPDESEED